MANQDLAESGDSDELEALFDSVASEAGQKSAGLTDFSTPEDKAFHALGQMTRQLHETLRALGYDRLLSQAVDSLPDARDRLSYVANLTEQAACRVLNATDVAMPIQERMSTTVARLGGRWDAVFAGRVAPDQFAFLADETRFFLKEGLPRDSTLTAAQLMEIVMAQEFQDLTGQVIKKVIATLYQLETQLMGLLVDLAPGEAVQSLPQALSEPTGDVESAVAGESAAVGDQAEVDDLLASLGF